MVLVLVSSGCGAPDQSSPEVVTQVPYELSRPSTASTDPTREADATLEVWLVRDSALVAVPVPARASTAESAAAQVMRRLASGPSDDERARGFSTALSPGVRLSVTSLRDGHAVLDIRQGGQAPGAGELPLAVGQVVLTLTSIPGVDDVSLTADGERIPAPLPGGVLTERPLDARDYTYLIGSDLTASPSD
ncbi:hypothetical protein GCM10009867_25670 [Pedococcus aerophilus]|uniref:GerMN domain-containing protein n=2 Tax=Pedococcus aerophilus TaxID=436356 RepID=A0ABN3URM9_9MICO